MQQSWFVGLYYVILIVLTFAFRFIINLTWWSAFVLSLLITLIVIIFTGPDWYSNTNDTFDIICLCLLIILVVLEPIILSIYIIVNCLVDRNDRVCAYVPPPKPAPAVKQI
jgi:hypothetical protein